MSKKISSIVTSIAGVMVAIPTTSDANIATTGYVNKIVNQTHAVGSALQFGLLSDNATPLFMLGATNQPTTGANGGSLVGSYGAISVEKLALALTPNLMGSAITGFITGSGSHILVGDGTTSGTAGWTSLSTIGPKIAGFEYARPYEDMTGVSQILMQGDASGHAVYYPTHRFTSFYVKGSYISGFGTGSGSHVLVGNGTTTGTAAWSSVNNMLTQLPEFLYNGELQEAGDFKMLTYYHPKDADAPQVSWEDPRGFLANLYKDRGWPVTSPVNTTGVTHILAGTPDSNYGSNIGGGHAAWTPLSALGTQMTYGTATGSFVLVGSTTTGTAGWSSVEDMLKNGLNGGRVATGSVAVPMHVPGKDYVWWADPISITRNMVLGSVISGYTTGSGSYVLVGDGTTSGTAAWSSVEDIVFNAPYSTVTRDFHNVLVNQEGNGTHTNLKMPKTTFGSLISPHIQGSAISGYTTGSTAPTYILGTSATGATGATMQLHAISGLGSEIKFTETKTAAELKATTGTIYFPVVQNGQIYGVTLNDFYILMNAKF